MDEHLRGGNMIAYYIELKESGRVIDGVFYDEEEAEDMANWLSSFDLGVGEVIVEKEMR